MVAPPRHVMLPRMGGGAPSRSVRHTVYLLKQLGRIHEHELCLPSRRQGWLDRLIYLFVCKC